MSLSAEKIELIDKWRVNAALRSVEVFDNDDDDCEIFEIVNQLTLFNNRRENRDKHMLLADQFINLGLTSTDYSDYQVIVDAREKERRKQQWVDEFNNNELIKRMHDQYKFKEVTGRGKNPKYFEAEVNTDLHGLIKIKGRLVPAKRWYQSAECFCEFKLPNKEQVKFTASERTVDVDRRFPISWWDDDVRDWSDNNSRKTESFYNLGIHMIRKIEREYKIVPRKTRKKDVAT